SRPDDSHTNLGWDDALNGFSTHPMRNGTRLFLRVPDLALQLSTTEVQFRFDDLTDAEVRSWLVAELNAGGLDARKLDEPAPYEIPAHALAGGSKYSTVRLSPALRDLTTWYSNANGALAAVTKTLAGRGLRPPAVRCWPHHFDLDSLISLD